MNYAVYLSSVKEYSDPNLLVELAHEAEQEGWDGVFIWDHIGHPNEAADPWVTLGAIAAKTKHLKIGPVVTPVARRRPWKLARETVTLDHLSGGRLILGVGLGWTHLEFEAFGEAGDLRTRAEKLDEGLEVLAGLWRGEKFSHHGRYYQVEDARLLPPPLQTPRIPIWPCAAWSAKKAAVRRAARWDGVVAVADPGENRAIRPDEVAEVKKYIQRHSSNPAPFDIAVLLRSQGGRTPKELQETAAYAEAGTTWWLEGFSTERFSDMAEVRARIRKGPPGE